MVTNSSNYSQSNHFVKVRNHLHSSCFVPPSQSLNGCRGLSLSRSLSHCLVFSTLFQLIGVDVVITLCTNCNIQGFLGKTCVAMCLLKRGHNFEQLLSPQRLLPGKQRSSFLLLCELSVPCSSFSTPLTIKIYRKRDAKEHIAQLFSFSVILFSSYLSCLLTLSKIYPLLMFSF